MDSGYEVYCLGDRDFYDSPVLARADDPEFPAARRPAPDGWVSGQTDDWQMYAPSGHELPPQGWKIHVSACLDNAEEILDVVWEYCVARARRVQVHPQPPAAVPAQHEVRQPRLQRQVHHDLPARRRAVRDRSSPTSPRSSTAAPAPTSSATCAGATARCTPATAATRTASASAPTASSCPPSRDADGELVPDRRAATFQVPAGVTLPACLEPHLAARNSATMDDLPYRIERALHFSNGGGLYAGVDTRTGEQVVFKEARPYAGLGLDEEDAVARLHREHKMLTALSGLGVVPEARDVFEVGGHHFLVMDFVDGEPLNVPLVQRYPLIVPYPSRRRAADLHDLGAGHLRAARAGRRGGPRARHRARRPAPLQRARPARRQHRADRPGDRVARQRGTPATARGPRVHVAALGDRLRHRPLRARVHAAVRLHAADDAHHEELRQGTPPRRGDRQGVPRRAAGVPRPRRRRDRGRRTGPREVRTRAARRSCRTPPAGPRRAPRSPARSSPAPRRSATIASSPATRSSSRAAV